MMDESSRNRCTILYMVDSLAAALTLACTVAQLLLNSSTVVQPPYQKQGQTVTICDAKTTQW